MRYSAASLNDAFYRPLDILLLMPPAFFPHMPYLGISLLQSYLQKRNIAVEQVDLNLETYHHFLSEDYLKDISVSLNATTIPQDDGIIITNDLILTGDKVIRAAIDNCSFAVQYATNKHRGADDGECFERILHALNIYLSIVSDKYYPTKLTFSQLKMSYSHGSSSDVYHAIYDETTNMFIDYFRERLPVLVEAQSPGCIGISIDVPDQVIPGFTLCRMIKDAWPSMPIILGGNIITRLKEFFIKPNILDKYYDVCIFGEGEVPLYDAILFNKKHGCFDSYNWRRVQQISITPDDFPCPTFDDLSLDSYFSRNIVLPILASRRCYWDRCNFCSISHGYSPGFRQNSYTKVVDHLEYLSQRHNAKYFKFVDDAAPPALLVRVAEEIIRRKLTIRWEAYTILEDDYSNPTICNLLYEAGCRWLYFGMETADRNIAKKMNKRIPKTDSSIILRAVHDSGIKTHIWVVIGFPGDNANSVARTKMFIEQNRDFIDSVEVNQFALVRSSPIMQSDMLSKLGMQPKFNELNDIALTYEFTIENSMCQSEAAELVVTMRDYLYRDLGFVDAVRSTNFDLDGVQ